jgi:ribosome-associated translation inhibitor RaiA
MRMVSHGVINTSKNTNIIYMLFDCSGFIDIFSMGAGNVPEMMRPGLPMQIDIQSTGFSLADTFVNYYRRQLNLALVYCSGHVRQVVVRLSDINVSRGCAQKRCQIQVMLAGMPDVVIEDTQADLYAAIDRAVARTKRTVVRNVDRLLTPQAGMHALESYEPVRVRGDGQISMGA